MLMDNVARPPPGTTAGSPSWRPFDMKGIRLYSHETRLRAEFGRHGLYIGARRLRALRSALQADLRLLTSWSLVDYSYLLSVFPTGAAPQPCEQLARHADFAAPSGPVARGALLGAPLLPAFYRIAAHGDTEATA
eukprot:6778593-Prymnesium_polylepis.2